MKKILFSCFAIAYGIGTQAQQLPNRYLEEVFPTSQVNQNVIFSTTIPTVKTTNFFGNKLANEDTYGQTSVTLKMDIYRPTGDTLSKKPVIIFAFGGGFVNGSRTEKSMLLLCQAFAKRGFVTATIDYRLGMNIGDKELSKRAVYRALQDGRSAVRFFRKNAATYGIDPNQIYISGHSAGAFLAYHSVYLDKDAERPASTRNYLGRLDLGGLDDIGDNKTYDNGTLVNGKANGVMGFAGALGELNYIEGVADVAGVYFHSSNDSTVPYNSGEPFSSISWLPGFNLPTVYGSNEMNTKAITVNASRTFFPYTNRGHNVHYNGSTIYSDISTRGGQFFYDSRLKPSQSSIAGSTNVCANCPPQTYSVPSSAYFYDWQVVGGTFINKKSLSNSVLIQWDAAAITHSVSVTPYSRQLAKGNATSLQITINQAPALAKSLDAITDLSLINLNDYFTDPEGQPLYYKITSSSNEIAKINNPSNGLNNILDIEHLTKGLATITIEVNDGSNCSTIHSFQIKDTHPLAESLKIVVSPNPFAEKVTISLDGAYKGNVKILLYNEKGVVVAEKNILKGEEKLEESFNSEIKNKGIHYIKVISDNAETIKRIIKN